jgi:hypothetical protein
MLRIFVSKWERVYGNYVRHLPEVGPEVLGPPGVTHMVCFHDDWCRIYDGKACSCGPEVRFYAEPRRT